MALHHDIALAPMLAEFFAASISHHEPSGVKLLCPQAS